MSPEHHLWNRFYCAVVSGNTKVIAEIVSDKKTDANKDSQTIEKSVLDLQHSDEKELATTCVEDKVDGTCVGDSDAAVDVFKVLNERWGESGSTLLHLASKTSQTDIIYSLLHHGADPGVR